MPDVLISLYFVMYLGFFLIIVVVLSLGDEAKISIADKEKNFIGSIIAENNSLYIMNKDFQNNLLHKVGDSKGIRYSLTFRNCVI